MAFLGIGEILGSITIGTVIDKIGGNFPIFINILLLNI